VSSGWAGGQVTVPMPRLTNGAKNATVCVTYHLNPYETIDLRGAVIQPSKQGNPPNARLRVEYLRPGSKSWWSQVSEVARRMGLGRAAGGTWNALLVLLLMIGVTSLCAVSLFRELR
jgi:hypothetical protein